MRSRKSFYSIIFSVLIIIIGLLTHSLFVLSELQDRVTGLEQKIENPQTRMIPVR